MAERLVLVCDICGSPAEQSVTFRAGGRSLAQDLCSTHYQELIRRSHTPKRGRRPGVPQAPKAATAPRRGRKSAGKSAAKKSTQKRTRRRITDPAVLERRLAALAKARAARAAKRAAAQAS